MAVMEDQDSMGRRRAICPDCGNRGIGLLGDSPDRLRAAIEYLKGDSLCR